MSDKMELVLPGISAQELDAAVEAQKEAQRVAYMAKLQREYDDFNDMKAYVLKHLPLLRGRTVPIEVGSIQFLPTLECIIVNDLILVSYSEAMDMIANIKKEIKNERSKDSDSGRDASNS